jgi:hypothetical protein
VDAEPDLFGNRVTIGGVDLATSRSGAGEGFRSSEAHEPRVIQRERIDPGRDGLRDGDCPAGEDQQRDPQRRR